MTARSGLRRGILWGMLLLAACGTPRYAMPPGAAGAGEEAEFRRLRTVDPGSGAVIHSWTVLVHPDGRVVKHGREERFFPDGARRSLQTWRDGEPVGDLLRWYESGSVRSVTTFDPGGALTPMRFWHEGGELAAEGPARRGVREGYWRFWYEDGAPRERGGYVDGRRSGLWSHYWPDGSVQATGRYEEDERVGPWRHFEPGEQRDPSEAAPGPPTVAPPAVPDAGPQ